MHLKILLPSQIFADSAGVTRIVAETPDGSFGLLPHRLDCVAALVPGIFIYQPEGGAEVFVGVDQGVLVKSGPDVLVSVRRAIRGSDLAELKNLVERQFSGVDEDEQSARYVIAKLEMGVLRRLAAFQHE